ncbi:(5-formylfuran-3-yl)methyl phosphate synthase [Azohydromonas lata]|uniref:(5-formylfuran-3-yl)methyl phosphate synthase n=1 Tax=Azohydromonas lata TaxID=45677 RepID=A0ABU5IGI2_9BURK|nr:(5-formylfuran-3-yl)methyl phosphate synthase [Azohydromonas lata]MDZ5458237.1 (5-formylfuran-3-yl)methyl phosphate synthase [Azohydromonas lata]
MTARLEPGPVQSANPRAAEPAATAFERLRGGGAGRLRMLASVRDLHEARLVAEAGVDVIDLKEPAAGALGAVPLHVVHEVVVALRAAGHAQPVTATVGDWPVHARDAVLERVRATAACGVDVVKVGVERADGAAALLAALAGAPAPVVPVFFADQGLDEALLALACWLPFPGVMLDTAGKADGSLLECLDAPSVRHFITRVQGAGKLAGIAGSLRASQAALLRELAPDLAGFRGALCEGGRAAGLSPQRLQALATEINN